MRNAEVALVEFNTSIIPGLLVAVSAGLLSDALGQSQAASITSGCHTVRLWWIFEPIPIPVTSLVPMGVLPLGVITPLMLPQRMASTILLLGWVFTVKGNGINRYAYADSYNGGEVCCANEPKRLILGLCWRRHHQHVDIQYCNCPDAIACGARSDMTPSAYIGTAIASGLVWAYWRLGTPIGTPPTLSLCRCTRTTGTAVSFSEWMTWGIPVVVDGAYDRDFLARQVPNDLTVDLPDIGGWRSAEKRVLIIFAATAVA